MRPGQPPLLGHVLLRLVCVIAAALIVAGCTSVPQASEARDAEAKQFNTHPATAAVYVYRIDFGYSADPAESTLWMDRRLIGATLPRAFFRIEASPGRRVLH